jgi:ferrous iron transport protein A
VSEAATTLDRLAQGQTARVTKIGGERALRRRLMDMGITKRVEITMVKASPLGDPVEYRLRGYSLSLGKAEAKLIEVVL